MKKNISIFLTMTIAALLLTACTDELENGARYNDGYLHFKFLFNNEGNEWNEDGTAPRSRTRLLAPLPMTQPEGMGDTLYLHCIEADEIVTANDNALGRKHATRGQRLTGHVFGNGINTFGIYGKVGDVLALDTKLDVTSDEWTGADTDDDWKVKEQELLIEHWDENETGKFYAYAPHTDEAQCITVANNASGAPTLTFTMDEDEANNKDILTAYREVSKKSGNGDIELEFRHVLSALKFKLDYSDDDDDTNDNDLTSKIGDNTYIVKVKSIALKGIRKTGTLEIGTTTTWTPGDATGSCTYDLVADERVNDDIVNDDTNNPDKLVNTDEHCFMVLPQTFTAASAKVVLTVDLILEGETTPYKENLSYEASFPAGTTWEPGHSYTYKLSKYSVMEFKTFTSKPVNGVGTNNADFPTFDVNGEQKGFKVCSGIETVASNGTTTSTPVNWHLEYKLNGSDEWVSGKLPYGWYILGPDGKTIKDLSNIPGSVAEQTYKLVAQQNTAYPTSAEASVVKLRKKRYGKKPTTEVEGVTYVEGTSQDEYYDLSTKGGGTQMNTANCYMVDGWGKFKLPIVYGNAIKNGATNANAYTETTFYPIFVNYNDDHVTDPWISTDTGDTPASAEIVWEDEFGLISSCGIDPDDSDYLCFEVDENNIKNGNAVIAVKNSSGTIMWSWHIWVTTAILSTTTYTWNSSGTGNVELLVGIENKYNLGSRTTEEIETNQELEFTIKVAQNGNQNPPIQHGIKQNKGTATIGGSNVYYEFGRKDPFPAVYKNLAGDREDGIDRVQSFGYTVETSSTGRSTIGNSIQHPNYFYGFSGYSSGNWVLIPKTEYPGSSNYVGMWDAKLAKGNNVNTHPSTAGQYKTIFDPCPVGYTVPPYVFPYMIYNFGASETLKNPGGAVINYISKGTPIWPLCGSRGNGAEIENFDEQGYYWSASYNSNGTLLQVYKESRSIQGKNTRFDPTKQLFTSRGASVRPAIEKDSYDFTLDKALPATIYPNITGSQGKGGSGTYTGSCSINGLSPMLFDNSHKFLLCFRVAYPNDVSYYNGSLDTSTPRDNTYYAKFYLKKKGLADDEFTETVITIDKNNWVPQYQASKRYKFFCIPISGVWQTDEYPSTSYTSAGSYGWTTSQFLSYLRKYPGEQISFEASENVSVSAISIYVREM